MHRGVRHACRNEDALASVGPDDFRTDAKLMASRQNEAGLYLVIKMAA
jgi:hypothetical protein